MIGKSSLKMKLVIKSNSSLIRLLYFLKHLNLKLYIYNKVHILVKNMFLQMIDVLETEKQ